MGPIQSFLKMKNWIHNSIICLIGVLVNFPANAHIGWCSCAVCSRWYIIPGSNTCRPSFYIQACRIQENIKKVINPLMYILNKSQNIYCNFRTCEQQISWDTSHTNQSQHLNGIKTIWHHFRGSKELQYHSPLCLSTILCQQRSI